MKRLRLIAPAIVALLACGLSACSDQAHARSSKDRPTPRPGMVLVPGGTFRMGYASGHDDEKPEHDVALSPFHLDRHEVTNRKFAEFVKATGHVTRAERDGACWCYLEEETEFRSVTGADWRHPQGPGSSIEEALDHPVVCVTWEDASSYARWAGKRLPTEAEWEYAARGGSDRQFAAARSAESEVIVGANFWQGVWPEKNELADGFFYTSPAGSFAANGYGVHDMVGNVWEWTSDWYAADWYARSPTRDPRGPESGENRVARGGSWFCSPNYCGAYSTHFRGASPPDHAFNNVGFRCAADAAAPGKAER